MSERPWMPMYWGDYVKDTLHLNTFQHGCYLLLIAAYWIRGGPLPNDPAYLAQVCRTTQDKLARYGKPVLGMFSAKEGLLVHKRVEKELLRTSARSASASAAAQQRARGRHSHSSETQSPSTQTESLSPASKPPSAAPNGAGHSDRHAYQFDDWWACWDIPGTKKDRAAAERKYRAAIKADAATHEALCDGVRRYMAWCRKERREVRYIKAPDVWLNKGCWADELGATGPPTTQRRPFEDLSDYTAENYPPQPPGGRHD